MKVSGMFVCSENPRTVTWMANSNTVIFRNKGRMCIYFTEKDIFFKHESCTLHSLNCSLKMPFRSAVFKRISILKIYPQHRQEMTQLYNLPNSCDSLRLLNICNCSGCSQGCLEWFSGFQVIISVFLEIKFRSLLLTKHLCWSSWQSCNESYALVVSLMTNICLRTSENRFCSLDATSVVIHVHNSSFVSCIYLEEQNCS